MPRGHKLTHLPALDMPERLDPSGIPCIDSSDGRIEAPSAHGRHPRSLPGLAPTSFIASAEEVASNGCATWCIWGSVDGRPVLFAVEGRAAAEMMSSVTAGEIATAIIEPWQLVLERLD